MKCSEIELLLIDYLDNGLDAATRAEVDGHLHECEKCSRELKEMQVLQDTINAEEMAEPSPALRRGFLGALREEANHPGMPAEIKRESGGRVISIKVNTLLWRAAAAVIILAVGIIIGNKTKTTTDNGPEIAQLNHQVQDLKTKLMVNMLDDESPSQRIEAVNYAESFTAANQQVVTALFNTLNTDKSANVRLAALYSLAKFTDDGKVLDSLVASLPRQTEPIVQVVLINMLTAKKVAKARQPIQDIIQNGKTIQQVKDVAEKGLKQL